MRHSGIRTWSLLLLLLLTLLWGASRGHVRRLAQEGIYPYENGLVWFVRLLNEPALWLAQVRSDVAKFRALEDEIVELRRDVARLEPLAHENTSLRRLLGMRDAVPGRLVACAVLSRGGAGDWWKSLRVAGGERDGIRVNQPVLGPEGLVGRIVSVSARTSEVLLIADPNSRVACVLDPGLPGWRGVAFGGGSSSDDKGLSLLFALDPLLLRFLDRDIEIPDRARVLTSGLGGLFPPGILVGHVVASRLEPGGLYRVAEVAPAVDPWTLTHVLVMVEETQP